MLDGVINLLKPPGVSSNHALLQVRRLTGEKKSGHAGTLDPLAAGVLPVLMGRAARLFDYTLDTKEYIAEIYFGISSDTLDCEGQITETSEVIPSQSQLIDLLGEFTGEIEQIPPQYSALKVNGMPMYKRARLGLETELPSRKTVIHELVYLRPTSDRSHLLRVRCSKGTYIRTLCADIAQAAGSCALMSFLLRTNSGGLRIEDAFLPQELELLKAGDIIQTAIQPMDSVVTHLPALTAPSEALFKLANGNKLPLDVPETETARLYCSGRFLGLCSVREGILIPKVLLVNAEEVR